MVGPIRLHGLCETKRILLLAIFIPFSLAPFGANHVLQAQGIGLELHNTLMPASGGMGGASLARPQDLQSALAGNPATLARFRGTQFSTGASWLEPTFNLQHDGGILPGIGAFSAKSESEGNLIGGFAVAQDLRAIDIPATIGAGLFASAGAGLNFNDVPQSNGTADVFSVLQLGSTAALDLTDRLSAGASIMLGTGSLYGPFVGVSSSAYDYALRGSLGLNYDLGCRSTFGVYYQTEQSYNFDNAIRLQLPGGGFGVFQDIDLELPRNIGIGYANESLMDGRLLLAVDVLYKNWSDTDLFGALYDNQWAFLLGTQYAMNDRIRLRLGYVYAENIMLANPGNSAGGITPPGAQAAIQYIQAQFPAMNQHRFFRRIRCPRRDARH